MESALGRKGSNVMISAFFISKAGIFPTISDLRSELLFCRAKAFQYSLDKLFFKLLSCGFRFLFTSLTNRKIQFDFYLPAVLFLIFFSELINIYKIGKVFFSSGYFKFCY